MTDPSLRWLLDRPTGRTATSAYLAGRDAPAAVLAAMVADGLLVPVTGGLHLPADLAAVPQARAAALAQVVPPGAVAGTRTALWVRGLLERCGTVEVVLPPGAVGGSRPSTPWLRVRGAVVAPEDVEVVGGLRVTELERTAADLARWAAPQDAVGLVAVAIAAGCDPVRVLDHLEAVPRRAGVRRAREVLAAAVRASALVPAPRQAVDVEHAVHPPHRGQHVVQVRGVGHLEGEPRDRDAVA